MASSMLVAGLEQELAGLQLAALPVEERIGLEQARLFDRRPRASGARRSRSVPVLRGMTTTLSVGERALRVTSARGR